MNSFSALCEWSNVHSLLLLCILVNKAWLCFHSGPHVAYSIRFASVILLDLLDSNGTTTAANITTSRCAPVSSAPNMLLPLTGTYCSVTKFSIPFSLASTSSLPHTMRHRHSGHSALDIASYKVCVYVCVRVRVSYKVNDVTGWCVGSFERRRDTKSFSAKCFPPSSFWETKGLSRGKKQGEGKRE